MVIGDPCLNTTEGGLSTLSETAFGRILLW